MNYILYFMGAFKGPSLQEAWPLKKICLCGPQYIEMWANFTVKPDLAASNSSVAPVLTNLPGISDFSGPSDRHYYFFHFKN